MPAIKLFDFLLLFPELILKMAEMEYFLLVKIKGTK
jgi:hypothetical protein